MRLLLVVVAVAGCLGEATTTQNDLSATVFDLSQPSVDLGGMNVGDGGPLYNCVELNNCEKACAGDPKLQMCIATCESKATMAAVMKEKAVQSCFNQYCPQQTDAGTSAICTTTDMGLSSNCTMCIQNTQVAPANMCTSVATPAECHNCYDQALACVNDK